MIIATYKDDFSNRAEIEKTRCSAYKGAKKTDCYRLVLYSEYDNDFIYHVTCYETREEAENKLKGFSCGSFREVVKTA